MAQERERAAKKRKKRRILLLAAAVLTLTFAMPFVISAFVKNAARPYLVTPEKAAGLGADCILVLGAGVWDGGTPSPMLRDRLTVGIAAYETGAADKLLMSGDHGRKEYDEVNVMKAYAVEAGVPSQDVFMDHAGFSTYESMYRAREVFQAKKVLIVTQGFHLPRAVYVARALGLDAYGVASDLRRYKSSDYYELREVLARCKDVLMVLFQPLPTYLGEAIPVWGNGNATND